LKKIKKDYLVDCIYGRINTLAGRYGISNADISKRIGWDSAGFNQKYNRSNDLRITTFVKIYVALTDLIGSKEREMGLEGFGMSEIRLNELITPDEIAVGALFNHISEAAEGEVDFLSKPAHVGIYKKMKPFVLASKRNKRFSDREIGVYIGYYRTIADTQ
ncbi:MAG: hypothetical protein RSC06_12660, partial [Clostridia bacterium]